MSLLDIQRRKFPVTIGFPSLFLNTLSNLDPNKNGNIKEERKEKKDA